MWHTNSTHADFEIKCESFLFGMNEIKSFSFMKYRDFKAHIKFIETYKGDEFDVHSCKHTIQNAFIVRNVKFISILMNIFIEQILIIPLIYSTD